MRSKVRNRITRRVAVQQMARLKDAGHRFTTLLDETRTLLDRAKPPPRPRVGLIVYPTPIQRYRGSGPMSGFNYMVPDEVQGKVAFMSSIPRFPGVPTSYFEIKYGQDRRYRPDVLAPATTQFKKAEPTKKPEQVRKRRLSSILKSMGVIEDGPPPNKYNVRVFPPPIKMYKYPFNSKVPRITMPPPSKSPGMYIYDKTRAERGHPINYCHSFGGKKLLEPAVQIRCTPIMQDICKECNRTPVGDYWFNGEISLCRKCYKTLDTGTPASKKNLALYKVW